MTTKKRIDIYVPEETVKWIKAFAERHNTSVSRMFTEYVENIRENYDFKRCGNCAMYAPPTEHDRGRCKANQILTEPDPEYDICPEWEIRPGVVKSRLQLRNESK